MADDMVLPRLRDDIRVNPGPRDHAGRPTWTLYDPLRNKFFQLDEKAFQLVCAWAAGTPKRIIAQVRATAPWEPTTAEIGMFFDFLAQGELLRVRDGSMRKRLETAYEGRQQSLYQQLIHNYLFFRVPLIRPDPWLKRIYPHVAQLLTARFLVFSAMLGLMSLALLLRQWETFVGGLPWFFTAEGAVVFVLTLAVVKILHEMGHALACRKYGVRVATMGVSLIVMFPVMYTDATDGWRLTSRRQRAYISAAGVTTELVLACYALAAWLVLPDGLPRSVAFTVATTTLVMSLLVNLNPFMRFDGYFFLSDMLNMPNLQERAFALGRWQMRTWLFGDVGSPPEHLEHRLHVTLIAYAWGVWVYRFFLFLGIALMVYNMFFKALGVFLFVVEIWFFVLRPIHNEMKLWPMLTRSMGSVRRRRWLLLGGGAGLLLLYPWQETFVVQAQWNDARYERIHAVRAGEVQALLVDPGSRVRAGQPLLRLASPEIDFQLRVAALNVVRLQSQLERSLTDTKLSADRLVLEQSLQRAQAEQAALSRVAAQMEVVAPFDGRVENILQDLHPGRWVSPDTVLLTIREASAARVLALVPERLLTGLAAGDKAWFFGEARGTPDGVGLEIDVVEGAAVTSLDDPHFAVEHGGEIPAAKRPGGIDMTPEISVYRVYLSPAEPMMPDSLPTLRLRGWVHFEGERSTLLGRAFRFVLGALIRESGF